jgi:hypothetical protein
MTDTIAQPLKLGEIWKYRIRLTLLKPWRASMTNVEYRENGSSIAWPARNIIKKHP